jgi:Xaa-Pro aminopeptidase
MIKTSVIEKISRQLANEGIDALLIAPSYDLDFVSGLRLKLYERFLGFVIDKRANCFCVAPEMHRQEVTETLGNDAALFFWEDASGYHETFSGALKDFALAGSKIAVNTSVRASDSADIAHRDGVEFFNGKHYLARQRMVKTPEDIENIRKASEIADRVMVAFGKEVRSGMTELEAAHFIVDRYREYGGSWQPGTLPIVASGQNSALPHYDGHLRTIEENDVILVDSGCMYNGYHSDTTRTFFIGTPTEEQKRVFDIVVAAERMGEEEGRQGMRASDLDAIVRRHIEASGYGRFFTHRTGHGIGIEIHELPDISPSDNTILEPGMVFSIEPGIYLPGKFGVRYENLVAVTDTGLESLNRSPSRYGI